MERKGVDARIMNSESGNFLGIPAIPLEDAQVIILPAPFEETTSYGHGAKNGPQAIITASQQVELYDHELGVEIQSRVKIATLPEVKVKGKRDIAVQDIIYKAAKNWTSKFLVGLGGEHSITPALVKAYYEKYLDLSILYFDAHTDMRDEWDNNKWSHACTARRCQEQGIRKIIMVGIRNTALSEQRYLNQDYINYGEKYDLEKILRQLSNHVYLSFDVDCLNTPYMPATGTSEPGGLSYRQVIEIFRVVAKQKNIVGADFVELAPIPGFHAYDFLVAKLIFKLIGFKYG